MATIGVKLNILTCCFRPHVVSFVRYKRTGLKRKSYGTYKNIEEYVESVQQKKEKLEKAKNVVKRESRPRIPVSADVKDLRYEHLGKDSKNKFANMMYNVKTSRYRQMHGVCALHGKQSIKDAINAGCYIRCIYFSSHTQLEDFPIEILSKTNLFLVSQNVMDKFAEKQVEGIYALVSQQDQTTRQKIITRRASDKESVYLPLSLICSGILDARIMGEVLNAACVTGCKEVRVMEGCVDIWNMEVLKTARGAHFKTPIYPSCDWEKLEKFFRANRPQNLFVSSDKPGEISLNDFVSDSHYQKISANSDFFRESVSEASIKRDDVDLAQTKLPCIPYHQMSLSPTSNVLTVGKLDFEAFNFIARMQALGSKCEAVTLPVTSSDNRTSIVTQTSVMLFEARRQLLSNVENSPKFEPEISVDC
uniref:RNA methyltransferase-like protein 1 n=1 Tax=Phallusia mammillata TaxID=59560 RepID=A0A6F9DQD4_9ASCI|nr:RNA methyltransferase-like protein 1 [Phallusia mammillata]